MVQNGMEQSSRLLSLAELHEVQAQTFIERVEFSEELSSTNDLALKLAADCVNDGPVLVVTNHQTGGRGRGSNRWWASSGSLTFSILLSADAQQLAPSRWPEVSLNVGLAIGEAIEALLGSHATQLKWPNDVYLEQRKVSGILVEAPVSTARQLVLGVGLNVNNSVANAPSELADSAIALCDVAGRQLSLPKALTCVLDCISERLSWIGTRDEELRERWRARCMLSGRHLRLELGTRCIEGLCRGIDDEGALIVETAQGTERCFAGVVTHF